MEAEFEGRDLRRESGGRDLWQTIAAEVSERRPVVTASIVRASGSVPRRVGAKMVVFPDGRTVGTVGGGLFETLVIRDGLQALEVGQSAVRSYSFNPRGMAQDAFGAVCGGRAEVFLEVVMPPDRLLIVGAGHCGRALAKAASLLDFSLLIVDDRPEYARPEDFNFESVDAVLSVPEDYTSLPAPDSRTYVVLVTRGFATDEAALRQVLDSPAAYIGMIGSKRKREVVFDRLRQDGIAKEKLARVHAPVGLEIGAETPEEVAISILAEVIKVRAERRRGQPAIAAPAAEVSNE